MYSFWSLLLKVSPTSITHPPIHTHICTLQHASTHIPPQRSSGVRPRSKTFEEYEKETDDAWDDREEEFSDSLPSELEVQRLEPLGEEGGEEGGARRNRSNSRGKGKSECVCVWVCGYGCVCMCVCVCVCACACVCVGVMVT